jgi:CRP-like cAMP-binding protein
MAIALLPLPRTPGTNRLLALLSPGDLRRIVAVSDIVDLKFAEVLYNAGQRLDYVYFPTDGFISLIMQLDHSALEVGLVGSEGMFGLPLALGVDSSPVRAVVQGSGSAMRMTGGSFLRQLGKIPALRRQMERYVFVHISQLAQASACTRFHVVEARLARWLLMTQDRAHADTFHITHEFLAMMLGVRRVGVTKAATALQKRKLIHYRRGDITVLDRRGLSGAACECYNSDRAIYEGMFR